MSVAHTTPAPAADAAGEGSLYAADSSSEVDAALTDMHAAAGDAVTHGGEAVAGLDG